MDIKKDVLECDTGDLAAQLAPAEEQGQGIAGQGHEGSVNQVAGSHGGFAAIVVDADQVNLSQDITDKQAEKTYLGMEPVVLVILVFMLTFIAFITWQISKMPVE